MAGNGGVLGRCIATDGVMGRWKAAAVGMPARDRRAKDSEVGVGDGWKPRIDDAGGVPGRLNEGEDGRSYGGVDDRGSGPPSDMSRNERCRPGGENRYSVPRLGVRVWKRISLKA